MSEIYSSVPVPGTSRQDCENCGSAFYTSWGYHDLCPACNGPYEEALHEIQQEELKASGHITTVRLAEVPGR